MKFRLLLCTLVIASITSVQAAELAQNPADVANTISAAMGKDAAMLDKNMDAATRIANLIFILSTRIHQGVCVILETKKELARVQAQPESAYKAGWIKFLVNDISTAQTALAKLMASLLQLTQVSQNAAAPVNVPAAAMKPVK